MNENILAKLDAIEKLVKEVQQEIALSNNIVFDEAALSAESAVRRVTLSLGDNFSDDDEVMVFDLYNMELEELWAFVNELELDLPKEATREDLIIAITARGW